MTTTRIILLVGLLSAPAHAKDVTYRLTGAEPLTFTIPDDWSSGWSPLMCSGYDPEAPVDLISFSKPPASSRDSALRSREEVLTLVVDARKKLFPLAEMQNQLRGFDAHTQSVVPARELRSRNDGTLLGYCNAQADDRHPGQSRLDAFWNLGSRTWTATSSFPADQTNWIAECAAIIETVRLADPDSAPPTPKRPTIDGVEDPDFPEEEMEKWRRQHE